MSDNSGIIEALLLQMPYSNHCLSILLSAHLQLFVMAISPILYGLDRLNLVCGTSDKYSATHTYYK